MRIKYFRIYEGHSESLGDGTEFFLRKDKVNFFDYEYIREIKVFPKISNQAVNCLVRNVDLVKKSLSNDECKFFCQKLVKLIYLRKDLTESRKFNIPIVFSPSGEALTGDGRILISTFYVPDIKFDCIFFKNTYTEGIESIEKLIMDIAEHKKVSLEEKTVLVAMQYKEFSNNLRVEYIRNLEFVDHYVYDQKLFNPTMGHYLSWNHLDYNIWSQVYDMIKKKNLSNINDYVDLLHNITSIEI